MDQLKRGKKWGFSLIEVVIATGILAMSVSSIMSLAIYTQKNTQFLLEKTYATIQASNGIEMVRVQRDQNVSDSNSATDWNNGSNDTANFSSDSFNFSGKTFTRTIIFKTDGKITSAVAWGAGGSNKITLVAQLTDWKFER
ncbi:MAG: hypothetical protein CEN89_219 [Candidatus Berkelbacteria bacterium Licking1014_7]|uniref:Prepilin-type N-terminal cleavage/methylation domain-containing protein n=1 Tax=Candidatus Berkelbacteria bacterium Licking1014_7 TaxID=2017147 RepID=A0A554LKP0_9BACT|nr:MAG: hypothetical protein CEN89_219 [Candidatus Berkelbacteria bacterium Licking1014_7]